MLDLILNPYYLQVASFILINIILGLSIYVTLASGQLSLGTAGFMAVGAYTTALLTTNQEMPIIIGILAGALLAGAIGILIGIAALRLQGVFLAIATLGFGEIVRVILVNMESVTNGAIGISGIPQMGNQMYASLEKWGFSADLLGLQRNQFVFLSIFIVLLLVVIFLIFFFVRQSSSRIGRAFSSIKMDENAAASMGVNVTYYKVLSFVQGAIFAGLAGALYAHVMSFISPEDFSYQRAVEILVFTVFGGSEVVAGAVFGGFFLTLLPEVLRPISEYRYMIYGLLLVALMYFRPQGIIDQHMLRGFKARMLARKGRSHGISSKADQ
ncbi:MAG TPA: branched-chain amino acid ABC transporter permease [Bacillus sp. (in: firmicutes)]|uniref:branched-chain amino acid ABC transporter permease n=1 Tax=Bacillus litorisediminis TaxID=2922713 RepID=UPI001FAC0620|nr:branched-chain amino acid ABC transporter permease [Bacillus litorisediminis]HWO76597.1 branched-chain amino acid ABC transporter permease [Bacillus sp. (in: firmicutes)]